MEDRRYVGGIYVTHKNYSGTEYVSFYSNPQSEKIYELTQYFDPIDDSDSVGKLKPFDISREDLALLIKKGSIEIPMASKLNDGKSLKKILTEWG